jgi:hypothetical protein
MFQNYLKTNSKTMDSKNLFQRYSTIFRRGSRSQTSMPPAAGPPSQGSSLIRMKLSAPTSETPGPFWQGKVTTALFSRPQELGTDLSLSRSQTLRGKLKKENHQKWGENTSLQRRKWTASWPDAGVAPQSEYISLHSDLQGLAMSRSFGDNVSKAVGVTCDP